VRRSGRATLGQAIEGTTMRRWLYTYRLVDGSPAVLTARLSTDLPTLLRRATDSPDAGSAPDGSFVIRLHGTLGGVDLVKDVRVQSGVAAQAGRRRRIPLRWQAEPHGHAFPVFEGALEIEPMSERHVQLTLAGSYRIPLGILGGAADGGGLHAVAERTADELLGALAAELVQPAAVEIAPVGGRGLVLRVRDVMTADPLLLDVDLPLRTAALLLFNFRITGAPVVGADGGLVGVLSERDLLDKEAPAPTGLGDHAVQRDRRRRARTVGEACSRPAQVTAPETSLRAAAGQLVAQDVGRLVVVDESRIVGIVTRHDVLRALVRTDAELQHIIDATLAMLGEPQASAVVDWGAVTLQGAVTRRSRLAYVERIISEVDGIVSVDADLGWVEDDLPPVGSPSVLA
jgi:CBS domain-containing protein